MNPTYRTFVYAVLMSFAVVLATSMAWSQDATGRVIGTVFDQQGKVVPGAKVTVTNPSTQIGKTTVTNVSGGKLLP